MKFSNIFKDPKGDKYWVETSGVISLSVVAILLIAYFLMDIYFFEKYLRYTFSPYIQLAIALGGILSKNWRALSLCTFNSFSFPIESKSLAPDSVISCARALCAFKLLNLEGN